MQLSTVRADAHSSRSKTTLFKLAAAALPILVLLLIEGALRLGGVGIERRAPFQPVPGKASHVALDPAFGGMFFRDFRPNVAFDPLLADKPDDALRIVALGGSTTAGFPYHWYYGFPALLEDRLAAALPGRHVEVANLGMTATNSFTIRALANAVVDLRPDAVVIYAGHNEYYGAYGTASTQGWTGTSRSLKRLLIGASRWSIMAGIDALLENEELPPGERRTLMARIVRDASIAPDSDVYRAGVAHYEANLRDVLRLFERSGIHVFIGTLASNLADQPPLSDDPDVLAAYRQGRSLLAAGDTSGARGALLQAKELDGIRFRAPEAMNMVIRRLAAERSSVTVVDIQERFRSENPGGLEGRSLFADHLHPNARGYALMADSYFDAMRAALPALADASDPGPASHELDPVEAGYADLQITILMSGYPFNKDRTPAEAEAIARAAADSMRRSGHYADALTVRALVDGLPMANVLDAAVHEARAAGDTLAALRLYSALLHWQPFNEGLIERAISYAIDHPTYDDETRRLARYGAGHAARLFSLNALAAIELRTGNLRDAESHLSAVERLDAHSPEMLFNRARLLVMQGDTVRAREYFERYRTASGG